MKFVIAITLLVSSFVASAQHLPRVNIGRPCRVLMIDSWHRPVAAYNGRIDILSGQCAKPMRNCRNDLFGRGYGRYSRTQYACVDERGRW